MRETGLTPGQIGGGGIVVDLIDDTIVSAWMGSACRWINPATETDDLIVVKRAERKERELAATAAAGEAGEAGPGVRGRPLSVSDARAQLPPGWSVTVVFLKLAPFVSTLEPSAARACVTRSVRYASADGAFLMIP